MLEWPGALNKSILVKVGMDTISAMQVGFRNRTLRGYCLAYLIEKLFIQLGKSSQQLAITTCRSSEQSL